MATSFSERAVYRPSGRANWPVFLMLALTTFAVASIVALLLAVLFWCGFYFVLIVPAVAALPIGGTMYAAVSLGKFRSPAVTAMIAILAGSIAFLGYFHCDMLGWIGMGNVHRVDLLPR